MSTEIFQKQNKFLILALDHRKSLERVVKTEQIIGIKQDIISALKEQISGVLIDPVFGLTAYKNLGIDIPFLLPLEKSGYKEDANGRHTEIERTVGEIKSLGASGVKLLIYFNPFNGSAENQIKIAKQSIEDSKKNELPLFLEILTYTDIDDDKTISKADLIMKSLQMFLDKGAVPDVFKLEYPDSADDCKRISELLGKTPWVLLSKGARFDDYKKQLKNAVAGGVFGFLAGRALWQELLDYQGQGQEQKKQEFLKNTLPTRFHQLSKIVLN